MIALAVRLAPVRYLAGSVSLVAVVAVLAWGSWSLRRLLVPEWSGAAARLAEMVMVLAVPIGVAQLFGTFGAFRSGPMLVGCLAVGVAMALVGRRYAPRHTDRPHGVVVAARRDEVVVAIVATGLVAAQWVTHVAFAFGRGMTHGDTLWYHAPFAARFLQTGRLTHLSSTGLSGLATPLHTYLPLNGSLAHAIAMLPFGNDLLSPLLNLVFFALALLAAWCIGRRRGVAPLCLLGTVALLGLPTLTGTQPGQASNDVVTTALFFAAVALLFEGKLAPAPTALAAVAAGLALGTKLTVAAPLAVLSIGVVVLALRARRPATAVAWCVALTLAGGYWLLRNWVVAGNPVPWSRISLGPFTLEPAIRSRPALITFLGESSTWRVYIFPGFRDALGRGWIAVLALGIGGAVLGIVRGRQAIERVAGLAALAGVIAFPFIPFTADLAGAGFVFFVRYLVPYLLIGFAALALALEGGHVAWRRITLVVLASLVLIDITSTYIEGIPAWPSNQRLTGVLAGIAVVAVAGLLAMRRSRTQLRVLALTGTAFALVCLAGGWAVQRYYLDHRYVHAGLTYDPVNAWFRDVHNQRVAVFGTEHFYPLFGADLSNHVSRPREPRRGSRRERCRSWRESLSKGGYRYIVFAHEPFSLSGPDEAWIASDPAVTTVLREGKGTVYRVNSTLDPDGCV